MSSGAPLGSRRRGRAAISLWDYCLRALHLREGAAGRRIGAMRVLRRFPQLEGAVRDGRLCLSTTSLLGQVLTEENAADLTARAAFKTKAEVDASVASLKPRAEPTQGIRRSPPRQGTPSSTLASPSPLSESVGGPVLTNSWMPLPALSPASVELGGGGGERAHGRVPEGPAARTGGAESWGPPEALPAPLHLSGETNASNAPSLLELAPTRPPEVRAVSADRWSLRVTLDLEAKRALETLTALLGHKVSDGDLGAVLKEALHCAIEKVFGRQHMERYRRREEACP